MACSSGRRGSPRAPLFRCADIPAPHQLPRSRKNSANLAVALDRAPRSSDAPADSRRFINLYFASVCMERPFGNATAPFKASLSSLDGAVKALRATYADLILQRLECMASRVLDALPEGDDVTHHSRSPLFPPAGTTLTMIERESAALSKIKTFGGPILATTLAGADLSLLRTDPAALQAGSSQQGAASAAPFRAVRLCARGRLLPGGIARVGRMVRQCRLSAATCDSMTPLNAHEDRTNNATPGFGVKRLRNRDRSRGFR